MDVLIIITGIVILILAYDFLYKKYESKTEGRPSNTKTPIISGITNTPNDLQSTQKSPDKDTDTLKSYLEKYQLPDSTSFICGGNPLTNLETLVCYIRLNNNELVFVPHYVYRHDNIPILNILVDDIKYFDIKGEKEIHVSGGGGGGLSFGGAVIGGLIAGPAGAIIGSREKTKPITTNEVDMRQAILVFQYNNKDRFMFLEPDAYKLLIKLIPQKEFNLVKSEMAYSGHSDCLSQIEHLSELKGKGIITEDEFNEKKKILLSKIN